MGRTGLVALLVVMRVATARAEAPSDRRLFLTGLALAPPTYLVGVSLHEGSHALAAILVGGTVDLVHLFPPGIDPRVNKFRFGWTYTHGITTRNKRAFFLAAPKITDALFLSTYAALYFTDALPSRGYGLLALTVGATGFWVDFAKDVVLFSPTNDVVKLFRTWCMTGWRQIPARLVYASLSLGFSYAIIRGYQRTFGDGGTTSPTSMRGITVPVLTATF